MSTNPLFVPQKEKAGSEAYKKFNYQYYWALCKALEKHQAGETYAVFMEVHEDAVFVSSLDVNTARFEFNQIKTTNGNFTVYGLTYIKKGSASVLAKLIKSFEGKPYHGKIDKVNLVTPNGFNLSLIFQAGIKVDSFCINKIGPPDSNEIANKINLELSRSGPLSDLLHFVKTDIPEHSFRDALNTRVIKLVESMFNSSRYNASEITKLLLDELIIKGEIIYDFADWNEFLRNKALTHLTVEQVVTNFTTPRDGNGIDKSFEDIISELGYTKYLKKRPLLQAFDRYRQARFFNKTILQLDIIDRLAKAIKTIDYSQFDDMQALFDAIINNIEDKDKLLFASTEDLLAAVIFEFIIYEKQSNVTKP